LCNLLKLLPLLPVTGAGVPDYTEADSDLLVRLAESAELALQIIHDGLASIGILHTYTAHQICDEGVRASHAAVLGRLQVELGEVLSAYQLGTTCRRYTSDHVPREDGQS
jgi:hypothetical protein